LTTGFTIGAGQVWLANVQCDGNETRLTDCTIPAFGTTNCSHAEDAGVSCPTCSQGDIRLRGGTATSGRLEICNNNVWGTVCDNSWSEIDAMVTCRQLGLPATGAMAITGAAVPDGVGQVWLDNVLCLGTESRLTDCATGSLGSNACGHEEDVGVNCVNAPTAGEDLLFSFCES
jgi:deleted-in-malignant-brain-tumors protein 1